MHGKVQPVSRRAHRKAFALDRSCVSTGMRNHVQLHKLAQPSGKQSVALTLSSRGALSKVGLITRALQGPFFVGKCRALV